MKVAVIYVTMRDVDGCMWDTEFENAKEALSEIKACKKNRGWKLVDINIVKEV